MAHDFKNFPELTNGQMQFYYFESPHRQHTEDFSAKVIRVIDGDTIRVKWAERDFETVVRFFDNAAPELAENGGEESKSWLEERIGDQEVKIEIDPTSRVDKWGRILGRVIAGGSDVGEESKMFGFSVPFEQRNIGKIPEVFKDAS